MHNRTNSALVRSSYPTVIPRKELCMLPASRYIVVVRFQSFVSNWWDGVDLCCLSTQGIQSWHVLWSNQCNTPRPELFLAWGSNAGAGPRRALLRKGITFLWVCRSLLVAADV